jgi:hypothetical protein
MRPFRILIPTFGALIGALDYLRAGDDNRKLCGLYLSIMDQMGVKLDHFGDAETRLARL